MADDVETQVQQLKKEVEWLDDKVKELLRKQNTNEDKIYGHDNLFKKLGERVGDLEKKLKK
jgi:peptidoglycan hydrolase CwlO-like protein